MHPAKAVSAAALLLASSFAMAGEYSDRLAGCLVESASTADRTVLVRWIFGAVASHPDVADISSVTPETWSAISRQGASVFEKLITDTCAAQSREAILNEGMAGYQKAFETLGATAAGGLLSDPSVARAMADLSTHLSEEKIMKALMTGEPQGE